MKNVKSAGTLIRSADKYLLCHATNLGSNDVVSSLDKRWSISKGLVDDGENVYDAAVRETREETGINLVSLKIMPDEKIFADLHYESFHPEHGGRVMKHLTVFLVDEKEGVLQHEHLTCHSMIGDTGRPEMDDFKWVDLNQAKSMCNKAMRPLFGKLSSRRFSKRK